MGCPRGAEPLFPNLPLSFEGEGDKGGEVEKMYKEHPVFNTPDDNRIIWRYLDFPKFLDILDRKIQFFPRADRLGDPFEGSYPKASVDFMNENLDKYFYGEFTKYLFDKIGAPKALARARRFWRKYVAISCWNMSDEESAALWKLYCGVSDGIAIKSTVGRFKESVKGEVRDIHIGEVNYINYLTDSIPLNNTLYPFLCKRRSFAYENELRAVISLPMFSYKNEVLKIRNMNGYYVSIDPNLLIDMIFISPTSPGWFKPLVESILSKYGLIKKVVRSDLSKNPIF